MKVLIATPCYGGMITQNYFISFLKTFAEAAQIGWQIGSYTLGNESDIRRARNRCAANFLNSEAKWEKLFFVDADIGWEWKHFKAVCESEKEIIGGTYPIKSLPPTLNFNPLPEDRIYFEGASRFAHNLVAMCEKKGTPEIEVKHIPTGFMKIERSVLENLMKTIDVQIYDYPDHQTNKIETHWDFFISGVTNKNYDTEDFGFCNLARNYGHKIHLRADAICTHYGNYTFNAWGSK